MMSGYRIGQVERIAEQPRSPLFAEITVRPRINLMHLREVMVVTGKVNENVVKATTKGEGVND
jgi:cell shape-determining protein MreC